jgi:hypothetical protein
MPQTERTHRAEQDKSKHDHPGATVAAELAGDVTTQPPGYAAPLAPGEGSLLQTQAARLRDRQVHGAQRYALARRIGRLQGNQHLQRVIGALGAGPPNPSPIARGQKRLADVPSSKVQRDDPAPAGDGPEMDAKTALDTMVAALNRSLKATKKHDYIYPVKKKLGPYATLTKVIVSVEGEIEASPKRGAVAVISHGTSSSTSSQAKAREYKRRKAEAANKGKSSSAEAQLKLKDTMKKLFDVDFPDIDLKWVNESQEDGQISGTIDVQGKAENGVQGGVKLGVYDLNLSNPKDSSVGNVSPYIGYEGAIPLATLQPRPLSWLQFPPIEVAIKGKITAEAVVTPNKFRILLAIARKFGPKIARRVAMITGSKAAGPIAARIVGGVKAIFSVPAAMVSAGIMSVLVLLDAILEGKRIRSLGTLAQRLAFVFSGAYVMEYTGKGSAPSGSSTTAQFAAAGAGVAKKHKKDILAKVKKQAEEEEIPMKGKAPAVLAKAVKKYIAENPVGIGTILPDARPKINEYILDRFVKGREAALTRQAMSAIVSVWGGSVSDVKGSEEYKKFKETYLPAYTSDKAFNEALENAQKDLENQGKPVTPENLNEALYGYFSEEAKKAEQELS